MNNVLHLKHPHFTASVLLQGAQLIAFQATGKRALFWHAKPETFVPNKPFRGGIPICWPWFGKERTPAHGFARIMPWKLQERKDDEDSILLIFGLEDSAATREIWDYAFKLTLQMILTAQGIEMELQVDTEVETTGALHTYFYTHDIEHVRVFGLGEDFIDCLADTEQMVKEPIDILKIFSPIDRIYTKTDAVTRLDCEHKSIMIEHSKKSDVVVWNPWSYGEKNIADMQSNDYKKMLCLETARITHPLQPQDRLSCRITYKDA